MSALLQSSRHKILAQHSMMHDLSIQIKHSSQDAIGRAEPVVPEYPYNVIYPETP